MNISVDLILIVINLLALAFSYGRLSEKILSIEKRLEKIADALSNLDGHYYPIKDGGKLEQKVDALHNRVDSQDRLLAGIKAEIMLEINNHGNGCDGFKKK